MKFQKRSTLKVNLGPDGSSEVILAKDDWDPMLKAHQAISLLSLPKSPLIIATKEG